MNRAVRVFLGGPSPRRTDPVCLLELHTFRQTPRNNLESKHSLCISRQIQLCITLTTAIQNPLGLVIQEKEKLSKCIHARDIELRYTRDVSSMHA